MSRLEEILEEYGYFLGRAYEDEEGKLAVHQVGKVEEKVLAWHKSEVAKLLQSMLSAEELRKQRKLQAKAGASQRASQDVINGGSL